MLDPQSVPYMVILGALAAVAGALVIFAWRRRQAPGAIGLVLLMLAVAEWSACYALEIGVQQLDTKIFWAKAQYFGIATVPIAWLLFALQVRTHQQRSCAWPLRLLTLAPLGAIILVWTNEQHGLIWQRVELDQSGPFAALVFTHGQYFWFWLLYAQVLLVTGTFLLGGMLLRAPNLYRQQIAVILCGIVAPWIANGLYVSKLSPVPHLDLTPFAFTCTGLAFAWSLLRFQFLEVMPVAHEAIVAGMRDGVIVLDRQQRIVDFNPAARLIVSQSKQDVIGRAAVQVLPPEVTQLLATPRVADEVQLSCTSAGIERFFDVSHAELRDDSGRPTGYLLVFRDSTFRIRAENALRTSEERYRVVSELTSDYAYSLLVDSGGRLTLDWVTDAFTRITGFTGEEVAQRGGWITLAHPEDVERAVSNARTVFQGNSNVFEFRIVTKAGETRWLRSYNRPIWNAEQQRVERIVGAGQDITEHKQAEAALRESDQRYRQLFDSSPDPMWVYDLTTRGFLAVNNAAVERYGYSRNDFLAMRLDDIRLPEDVPLLLQDLALPIRGNTAGVWRHVKRDGAQIMVEINSQPVHFAGRQARIVLAKDITERVQAEAALQRQNTYLAALHETTLALMNRLDVKDVLEAIVVRAAALVGTEHGYVYLVEPETDDLVVHIGVGYFHDRRGYRIRRDEIQGLAGHVRLTGQPLAVDDYQAWPGRRPDFAAGPFHANVGMPLKSGGNVIGVLGLAHVEPGRTFKGEELDILARLAQLASIALDNARLFTTAQQELAERKRAEADLALARDQALEAARLKADFLATMSHELRTPLNAIIGFTDLTLDETGSTLDTMQRSNLLRVSRNATSLLGLINGILDMSKIDAGHMQLLHERVFLDEIVQCAVSNIETAAAAKELRLTVRRTDVAPPLLWGDAGRLQQILVNLLSNAVKFTPQGGAVLLAVEWGLANTFEFAAPPERGRQAGQWITLSVRDTGVGIEPAEQERIWSEFYQVDGSATRQYGGTGLGLAIVKRLAALMGGEVGVASALGCGSTFTIWLPFQPQQSMAATPAPGQVQRATLEQELAPWSVPQS